MFTKKTKPASGLKADGGRIRRNIFAPRRRFCGRRVSQRKCGPTAALSAFIRLRSIAIGFSSTESSEALEDSLWPSGFSVCRKTNDTMSPAVMEYLN